MLLADLTLSACQKKDNTEVQPSKVEINISSPLAGQVYRKGDSVYIKADVSYISQMHGYTITLKDAATSKVLFEDEDHIHGDAFNISHAWYDSLSTNSNLVLDITVEIDHDGNSASIVREFKSQP